MKWKLRHGAKGPPLREASHKGMDRDEDPKDVITRLVPLQLPSKGRLKNKKEKKKKKTGRVFSKYFKNKFHSGKNK